MRTKILLIGEAPARDARKRNLDCALAGRALCIPPRLGFMTELHARSQALYDFVLATQHVNVLAEWPGGSAFPVEQARPRAQAIEQHVLQNANVRLVLLCGKRVAAAFRGMGRCAYLQEMQRTGATWVVVPHPSGVNRWYNDPENRRRLLEYLEEWGKKVER